MASTIIATFLLFLFFFSFADAGKKKSGDKIIIHVPYKIIKHHHTHTKYKVIAVPQPKKENTIIYLQSPSEPKPEVKFVELPPHAPPKMEMKETETKEFIPPHKPSGIELFYSLNKPENNEPHHIEIEEYSTIPKAAELHSSDSNTMHQGFTPSFQFKPPMMPVLHNSFSPMYSYKPMIMAPHEEFTPPKLMMLPSFDSFTSKFPYKPMMISSHKPKMSNFKPLIYPSIKNQMMHDNVAYASNQEYQTSMAPKPMENYSVKEPNPDDPQPKHKSTLLKNAKVPFKSDKKFKPSPLDTTSLYDNSKDNVIESDQDTEYEHVGYLIIDGNTKKIVGTDFKEGLNSWS